MHSGQNTMAKNYSWGKMQWRKRAGFGTIYTNKNAFQTKYIGKNGFLGKIQWTKRRGFGKIHTKKTSWAKYNRERRHFGQNTMEKSVKVSAKYIPKKHVGQNTIEKEGILGKMQWRKA